MEPIRFYLDEHIPAAVAAGLRRRGVDSLTVQEAGRAGRSDADQLAFARAAGRVIVTMDSDFLVLASQAVSHAGIAYESIDWRLDSSKHASFRDSDSRRNDEPC